jgi:hypothetical protein
MLTITPRRAGLNACATACFEQRKTPVRFTSIVSCQSLRLRRSKGALRGVLATFPALLTRMSSLPNSFSVFPIMARTELSRVTSQATGSTRRPVARAIAAADLFAFASLRLVMANSSCTVLIFRRLVINNFAPVRSNGAPDRTRRRHDTTADVVEHGKRRYSMYRLRDTAASPMSWPESRIPHRPC